MERSKVVKRASIWGIVGNIFLLIIKGIIGFITNSQAMIADFFNSAGDVFASFMTLIGNKVASKPNDDDHNLGHGKAEYIYSMLISLVMMGTSLVVLKDAVLSLFSRGDVTFSIWLIVVCMVTIGVKFLLYRYTIGLSRRYNNLLLKSNAMDHRNDCVITLCNLISCILSIWGIGFVDGIVGSGISIWIMITSLMIFRESYDVLMDKAIAVDKKQDIYAIIDGYDEILKVTHFNSVPIGYKYQVSFSIFVDGKMSTFDSHAIADKLEKEISKKIPDVYLTVIHVNPMDVDDK